MHASNLDQATFMSTPGSNGGSGRRGELSERLEKLEQQLGRLTDLLTEQTTTRKRRRRKFTLRLLLGSFVVFALLFAWFERVYHESRRQAVAVDHLVTQNAFVLYETRDNALVSLMPGDAESPPSYLSWLGDDFFRSVTNVSTKQSGAYAKNKKQTVTAVSSLPQLQRLRLTSLNLRTGDLRSLGDLSELRSLDLNRTRLDGGSMAWLQNTDMRWFNASHTRVGDRALYDLSKCRELQHLDMERTAISDAGLKYLYGMPNLRYLNLKRAPVSKAAVQQLSAALPTCLIEWEPLQFTRNGQVNVAVARSGYMKLGQQIPQDPRLSRRSIPPIDQVPKSVWPAANGWTIQNQRRGYNGYIMDVF